MDHEKGMHVFIYIHIQKHTYVYRSVTNITITVEATLIS